MRRRRPGGRSSSSDRGGRPASRASAPTRQRRDRPGSPAGSRDRARPRSAAAKPPAATRAGQQLHPEGLGDLHSPLAAREPPLEDSQVGGHERRDRGRSRRVYRIETDPTVPQFGEPNIHVGYDDATTRGVHPPCRRPRRQAAVVDPPRRGTRAPARPARRADAHSRASRWRWCLDGPRSLRPRPQPLLAAGACVAAWSAPWRRSS